MQNQLGDKTGISVNGDIDIFDGSEHRTVAELGGSAQIALYDCSEGLGKQRVYSPNNPPPTDTIPTENSSNLITSGAVASVMPLPPNYTINIPDDMAFDDAIDWLKTKSGSNVILNITQNVTSNVTTKFSDISGFNVIRIQGINRTVTINKPNSYFIVNSSENAVSSGSLINVIFNNITLQGNINNFIYSYGVGSQIQLSYVDVTNSTGVTVNCSYGGGILITMSNITGAASSDCIAIYAGGRLAINAVKDAGVGTSITTTGTALSARTGALITVTNGALAINNAGIGLYVNNMGKIVCDSRPVFTNVTTQTNLTPNTSGNYDSFIRMP